MRWLTPRSVDEALQIKADAPDAVVIAGGTFLGILMRHGLIEAESWLSLQHVPELTQLSCAAELSIGAMVRHRRLELDPEIRRHWPGVAQAFEAVASPRVRNVATAGGVLADADYASDPPSMLVALGAWVEAASLTGIRRIPVSDLIIGHYETRLADDELITKIVVPRGATQAVYRRLCTRTAEDRPCVSVSAVSASGTLRVVVGAVSDKPQYFPDVCERFDSSDRASAAELAAGYADLIDPISDVRGSADYRRRVVAVEVRRALEELAA
ncbi:MAG TPA: FAD binding domain-containing protein [Jiangellaceae bacterium]|nr:FAD binding domain-containing protein [Jiangellaceae bacterium]